MRKATILYILGVIGVFLLCIYLMTNGNVPVFDIINTTNLNNNTINYTRNYLEVGPGIALLVGLLAFLTSIFTNYYTNYKNEKNILSQLKQNEDFLTLDLNKNDMKKAMSKLKIILTKLSMIYSISNNVEGDYNHRIFCLYRVKKEQEWFNSLPNLIKDKINNFLKVYITEDIERKFSYLLTMFIVEGESFMKSEIVELPYPESINEEHKNLYIEMKEINREIEQENSHEINTFIDELLDDLTPDKIHNIIQNEFINDL